VPGLLETLDTLRGAGIATAGAGATADEAESPAILEIPGGRRVLVFAFGCLTSGIPANWSAAGGLPGVSLLADLSPRTAERVAERTDHQRRPGDVVVASVHWDQTGGTRHPDQQPSPASLIQARWTSCMDTPHTVKGIEIYAGKLILYGW
jgi:poly-gamma-glutamate synthesis protein (capsule biosynthesis protein)